MSLTTTRVFRWDDSGAPQLNSAAGSFYFIVKACLAGVGLAYGNRQKAGWVIAWDDPATYTIVLRNAMAAGGSGCYLRVQDNAPGAGGARMAKWDVYEGMTDINTGIGPAGSGWVCKSRSNGGPSAAWVLVADERTIYGSHYVNGLQEPLQSGYDAFYYRMTYVAGDFDPTVAGDPGVIGGACEDANPGDIMRSRIYFGVGAIGHGQRMMPDAQGMKASRNSTLTAAPTTVAIIHTPNMGAGIGGWPVLPSDAAAPQFVPALISDGVMVRGVMRGLYCPLNDWYGVGKVGTLAAAVNSDFATQLVGLRGSTTTAVTNVIHNGYLFAEQASSWSRP